MLTRRAAALLALGAVLLPACDIRTAGAPKGDLTLSVVFDDAQHLVPGHAVKVADVEVGTVLAVELEGFDARVTMSILDGRDIPVGTTASLSQTSLLGENYVRLEFPDGFDAAAGPFAADGDELRSTGADPTLEQVTSDALAVLGAIEGADLVRVVEALATGTGGHGEQLHTVIAQLADVGATFAAQEGDIAVAVDGLAALGEALAADDAAAVDTLLTDLAAASQSLAAQRERFVHTLALVNDLAAALDDEIVDPHGAELDQILSQLDDVAATLAADRATIGSLLDNLAVLSQRAPRAGDSLGGILIYGWITSLALPGDVILPVPDLGSLTDLLRPPGAEGELR